MAGDSSGTASHLQEILQMGHHTKRQKIVRLGLLRKPVAFRKPIAIPLCNAKCGALLQVEDRCNVAMTFVCAMYR